MTIWDSWAADPRYAQVVSDPTFLAATPAFKQKIHDILFNYGITSPSADQSALTGGMTIEDNPYSIINMLRRTQQSANHASINAANAAGLEESGAASAALNANNEAYKRNFTGALSQAGQDISGALGGYTTTIGDIFNRIQQNPSIPAVPAPQNPVGPLPGQATGGGTAFPTPQQPYQRTGPEAGGTVATKVRKLVKGNHGALL